MCGATKWEYGLEGKKVEFWCDNQPFSEKCHENLVVSDIHPLNYEGIIENQGISQQPLLSTMKANTIAIAIAIAIPNPAPSIPQHIDL
jgi:hypothetical protein